MRPAKYAIRNAVKLGKMSLPNLACDGGRGSDKGEGRRGRGRPGRRLYKSPIKALDSRRGIVYGILII